MKALSTYRFVIIFGALLLKLLYPIFAVLFSQPPQYFRLFAFTILVLASFNLAIKKVPKLLIILSGIIAELGLWCHYVFTDPVVLQYVTAYSTCFFYILLVYILTQNFLASESINIKVIIGAISGYLLIGFLGASVIEIMQLHSDTSFNVPGDNKFDFTYFSFVSILSVGYGDIVPVSNSAKSLTVLISLLGQFYMVIGIASFVGKFMNKQ